jgi:3D (Asp-Asp-Asp) domain-containing protein
MQRHALPVLILAFAVAVPVRASHTLHHTPATGAAPVAALPQPVEKTIFSSKGSRLEAQMSPAVSGQADKAKIADHAKKAAPETAKVAATPNVPAAAEPLVQGRLARLTAYWTDEDYWTSQHMSSTGARLQKGYCAVDPKLIPYGSVVQIPGMGPYLAVDTGSAVVSRQAALGSAQTPGQRQALVVANHGPLFAAVSWTKPLASADTPQNPKALPLVAAPRKPMHIYELASAPEWDDSRLPLNFRPPQL